MAKLRDKISELKTKYGISEDAAKEVLSLHDGDLAESNALLTAEQNKVIEWNKFWFTDKGPQIAALATEYERLKAQMDALEKAGVSIGNQAQGTQSQNTQVNPAAQAQPNQEEMEQRIYRNFSAVQKDLYNIQKYHFDNYKSLPDIAPIEKLIEEKKMTPWAAYQEWVAPMEATRKETELREKITTELMTKFQNDATRTGVNSYLLSNRSATTGEEVTSPLDEVLRDRSNSTSTQTAQAAAAAAQAENRAQISRPSDPTEFEQMSDFVSSMREGRSKLAH